MSFIARFAFLFIALNALSLVVSDYAGPAELIVEKDVITNLAPWGHNGNWGPWGHANWGLGGHANWGLGGLSNWGLGGHGNWGNWGNNANWGLWGHNGNWGAWGNGANLGLWGHGGNWASHGAWAPWGANGAWGSWGPRHNGLIEPAVAIEKTAIIEPGYASSYGLGSYGAY